MNSSNTVAPKLVEKSIAAALSAAYPAVAFRVRASVQTGLPMIVIRYADGPPIAAVFAAARQVSFAASFRLVQTTALTVLSTTYSDMVIGWR